MTAPCNDSRDPLVSVLVPTFNRRRYLREALESLLRQTYPHFEAFVVNDGGEPVTDVVESFRDPRLTLIDRRQNRGKAASLNEALGRARGTYVAYLDDDDRVYPMHLARLVETLQGRPDCGAAYTDLYKVHCRVEADGSRRVLGKVVNISRDFDRFLLCHFNHVLHVSLMHRRDLLERTGLYNESLRVLIDWDMTRRLAFFTDFAHVAEVTGEFHGPVGANDRISYRERLDKAEYLRQVMAIRSTRPPKPWPRMPDLSILYLPDSLDPSAHAAGAPSAAGTLRDLWLWTFMPYQVYLPLPQADLARLDCDMPNLVRVPVADGSPRGVRLDAALLLAEGDFVAVLPPGIRPACLWVEDPLHAALTAGQGGTAFLVAGADPLGGWPAVVLRREDLQRARQGAGGGALRPSLEAAGIVIRPPAPEEQALLFDRHLQQAQAMEREGNWTQAAAEYDHIRTRWANARWMDERAAGALSQTRRHDRRAADICRRLNREQPTVNTLLLEAKLMHRAERPAEAIPLLEQAETILSGKG